MNRLSFTIMLKQLFDLYLNGGFSFDDFVAIVDNKNTKEVEFDDNMIVLLETEIFYSLFQRFPYYKAENELRCFINLLTNISKKLDNYDRNARIIKSCLEDLIPTIKRIIVTIAKENVLRLINTPYVLDTLDSNTIVQSLLDNLSDPLTITGVYVARDYHAQYRIPGTEQIPVNLRDKVSKARANKSDSISKELRRDVLKLYSEHDFEIFVTKIKEAIEKSSLNEKEKLTSIVYDDILTKLYMYAVPKWNEEKDKNQLKLTL